ncbi:MAG: methionine adenosyltransferase [Nitrososphaeria archaeon]|jgi:S-adenosylmethionine synthetase|nr:methionine adenosyltransferase [Nitrososphaerota archaeon]
MIISAKKIPKYEPSMEFVERKGKGHPDTICDGISENLSVSLSKYYLEKTGKILHHNVDKAILVGGQAKAWFGGGEVVEPIYLMLVGRAIGRLDKEDIVPIGRLAITAAKSYIKQNLRYLDPETHVIVDYRIKQGSVDLIKNFEAGNDIPLANDTSFGVGFYPMTDSERLVLEVEKFINSKEGKELFPQVGEDVKVMALRHEKEIKLTIAAAMISSLIKSKEEYLEVKRQLTIKLLELSSQITKMKVDLTINGADKPEKDIYYLTVTGTSAENGDDGQVGRGNRANGLITPFRPMSLEATAGKNPISHTGKLYSVLAMEIAKKLVEENKHISSANVYMLSQIGSPITEPQSVYVEASADISDEAVSSYAESVVKDSLQEAPKLWLKILEGNVSLY